MPTAETTGAAAPSGPATYDSIAQAVHWFVAALAFVAVALGWAIAGEPRNTPQRDLLLLLHRSVGLTILAAMVFRTGWRWYCPPPPLPPILPRFEIVLAGFTHFVLYLFLILMPLAGYLNAAAAGHAVYFFGVVSSRRCCAKTTIYRKWRSRSICRTITRCIYSSRSTSRVRCSTSPSDATGSSSVWFRYAVPASRLPCLPG